MRERLRPIVGEVAGGALEGVHAAKEGGHQIVRRPALLRVEQQLLDLLQALQRLLDVEVNRLGVALLGGLLQRHQRFPRLWLWVSNSTA